MDGWVDTLPHSRADIPSYTEVRMPCLLRGVVTVYCVQEEGFQPLVTKLYYQMPFPVHYVGAAVPAVTFTHPDSSRSATVAFAHPDFP